jgi:preprotein translocase subunit YajC
MQSTLEVGDEVVLTSGVFGTVRGLDEAVAEVEIADGVTIRVARGAVGQLRGEPPEPGDAEPGPEHDPDLEVPEEN